MEPVKSSVQNMIIQGDCLEVLKTLPDNSVDSVVTDPPYGLSFMGKHWDYDVPSEEVWKECLRVLKPGGHLLSFAGTRTQHRMAVRIEDAGFEIRDMIAWVYGQGFPKSLNIGKAVDKIQGNKRESLGIKQHAKKDFKDNLYAQDPANANNEKVFGYGEEEITKGSSEWEGWGTALKPALEPITVARKPIESTVANNVLTHGTGGINIDGSRVGTEERHNPSAGNKDLENRHTVTPISKHGETEGRNTIGRWPANLIHDGSEEVLECFPNESHRFFYSPKASKKDRDEGLEGFEEKEYGKEHYSTARLNDLRMEGEQQRLPNKNNHPTVKPTALMRYLVKLVTPPGGTVLDPFTGSGSTGKACKLEGFEFIGIEREEEYVKIAEARIKAVIQQPALV